MFCADYIKAKIMESIHVKELILQNEDLVNDIEEIALCLVGCLKQGGKILLCGNGGSASDAIHIAGEIVGRFQKERKSYNAIALNADVASMTAIANDYGFDQIFARQVEGLMNKKDVLVGISTSGNSRNVIKAFEKAKEIGGTTVLLSGKEGGKLKSRADYSFIAPCDVTAHIQEAHECVFHILCGLIEDLMDERG